MLDSDDLSFNVLDLLGMINHSTHAFEVDARSTLLVWLARAN